MSFPYIEGKILLKYHKINIPSKIIKSSSFDVSEKQLMQDGSWWDDYSFPISSWHKGCVKYKWWKKSDYDLTQLFQSFFPITDIATYRLNLPRGQFIWNA